MTFASLTFTARIAIATIAMLEFAAPSRADGNLPPVVIGHEETILFPVPDCPKCLVLAPDRHPHDHRFIADCIRPD